MGESLDKILELIQSSQNIVLSSHEKTDNDALFSLVAVKKLIEKNFPNKNVIAYVDAEERLSDDLTAVIGKYKDLGVQSIKEPLTTNPDLFIALDCQIGRARLMLPDIKQEEEIKEWDISSLKKICLDHHALIEGQEYTFSLIDGVKYNSTTSMIVDIFEENSMKELLQNNDQILASLGYLGIHQDTGGMKKEIMTDADERSAKLLSQYMNHAKMHRLLNKRKNPLARRMIGEAFIEEELDKIENLAKYVFISKQINASDDSKLAEVANGILGCEESRGHGVIVAGIVHDKDNDQYSLGIKIRSDNPKNLPADGIAKILGGDGDDFKAGADIALDIFKFSTNSKAFRNLIQEEISAKLLGSELNEAADKKPAKQSLSKPTDLKELLKQNRESEYVLELHRDATTNMTFRGQKKFISYFVEKDLSEDDVGALVNIDELYHKLMGSGELKKTQASFIYGLVNQGTEPYIVGIISVQRDEKQSELGSAKDFAQKIFGSNISEETYPKNEEGLKSIIVRIPIPFIEYRTNSKELFNCVRYEMEERAKILGEKVKESTEKTKEPETK